MTKHVNETVTITRLWLCCTYLALGLLLLSCAQVGPPRTTVPAPMADDLEPAPERFIALYPNGRPYLGLEVEEIAEGGLEIAHLYPGPGAVAGLVTGDRIERVDGVQTDLEAFLTLLEEAVIGARLTLEVSRNGRRFDVALAVDDEGAWTPPALMPLAHQSVDDASSSEPAWFTTLVGPVTQQFPDAAAVDDGLVAMFERLTSSEFGANRFVQIDQSLRSPAMAVAWHDDVVKALSAGAITDIIESACAQFARSCGPPVPAVISFAGFAATLASAMQTLGQDFDALPIAREVLMQDAAHLLGYSANGGSLLAQPHARRALRAMQASRRLEVEQWFDLLQQFVALEVEASGATPNEPPADLRESVNGTILGFARVGPGFAVIGGQGPNTYRMSRLFAVIDLGGDDRYEWDSQVQPAVQYVDDRGGDDYYRAQFGGPGAGVLGLSVLRDRGGDDFYDSRLGGCGAGILGLGMLIDEAGRDTFDCRTWSIGSGLYGAGILLNRGIDADVYIAHALAQGIGGPGGMGLLLDSGGNDLYRANGPVRSSYNTPAVFVGLSQGVGIGLRPLDHGGIGVLFDAAGHDRYEGGEFSQGGGYFWGMGLLRDQRGDDLYYGNRYAQGFAAHQAVGILSEGAGNDVYWSMTAAGQGAAWDQSFALLTDFSGDDSYHAGRLSQGAAAHQSRGVLLDLKGDDRYAARSVEVQGVAGANHYHFDAALPVYSIGLLIDGAGADHYSSREENGRSRSQHHADGTESGEGRLGLLIDEP